MKNRIAAQNMSRSTTRPTTILIQLRVRVVVLMLTPLFLAALLCRRPVRAASPGEAPLRMWCPATIEAQSLLVTMETREGKPSSNAAWSASSTRLTRMNVTSLWGDNQPGRLKASEARRVMSYGVWPHHPPIPATHLPPTQPHTKPLAVRSSPSLL